MTASSDHTRAPEGGRREHRKRVTRRDLLAAGRRLFAEKGLYDSRIEDLSRRAGIAKGTLYGYFADKDDLIAAVVAQGFDELLLEVDRAAHRAARRTEVLARVLDAHLTFFAENPDLMRIFHQLRGVLKFGGNETRHLRDALRGYIESLAGVLDRHRGAGRDQRKVALLAFGAISGITSVHTALGFPPPRGAARAELVRSLVAMVRSNEIETGDCGAHLVRAPRPRARRSSRKPRGTS